MKEPFKDMREKIDVQVISEDGTKQLLVCYPTVESILLTGKNFGESFVQIFCFNEFFLFSASQYGIYCIIITLENEAIVSDESVLFFKDLPFVVKEWIQISEVEVHLSPITIKHSETQIQPLAEISSKKIK
jgi:hypothetical protein